MDSARGLRSSVRGVLALPPPTRRSRAVAVLRLTALAALLWGLAAWPAAAQPPYQQELLRGFSSLDVGTNSIPALADLDGDGDLDVVVGDRSGVLRYFANTGSSSAPAFVERTGTANPLNGIDVGYRSYIELADLNSDGILDAVVGNEQGTLRYFRNTGTSAAPAFSENTGTKNPFDGIDVGDRAAPELADVDGDGDLDLVVGETTGTLKYFENLPQSFGPVYTERTGSANPFNGIDVGAGSIPDLVDLDGDGDLDAIVGNQAGALTSFDNTGSSTGPAFVEQTGAANPFSGIDVGSYAAPDLADLDGDGDLDAVLGERSGTLKCFANTGFSTAAAFAEQTGTANPLSGIDFGFYSSPELADLDGDGDLDAVVGEVAGNLNFLANTGVASAPALVERTGTANPFGGIAVDSISSLDLVDLDGDGDLDAVVGGYYGFLNYFANTGSSVAPAFVERTGAANPLDGLDVGGYSKADLVDLDGDGDLDAVVGEFDGFLNYFANTGTSTAPAFVERTGAANPFNGIDASYYSAVDLEDLDRDGDLDAVVGNFYGTLLYFANTGSSSAPAFVEKTGAANPLDGIDIGYISDPDFADLDGDGDLDLISGDGGGHLVLYRSLDVFLNDGFETGGTAAWSSKSP